MKRSRKGVLLQGTIIMDKSSRLNREKFQESLIHFISDMLKEKIEQVDWLNNNSSEIEKVYHQFASLEWKKNRIKTKALSVVSLLTQCDEFVERDRKAEYLK